MTYITYKHLMVPNLKEIQQELRRFILPHCSNKPTGLWSINSDDFISSCPETVDYLKLNNLLDYLKKVCYIVVHPGTKEKDAHVDVDIEPPMSSGESNGCLSLNFGIYNCINTPVIFYEYLSGPKQYMPLPNSSEGPYIFYAGSELKEIDRYALDNPIIMNNTVPHAIHNDTKNVRISISFRFTQDPWHLFST
jgi:hypothetical protein